MSAMIELTRKSLVPMLLALSALFNVFFAAGYVTARSGAGAAAPPADAVVVERLGLDEQQATVFRQLRAGMEDDRAFMRDARELARQELAKELALPQPDLERVRAITEAQTELEMRQHEMRSKRFEDFLDVLSKDQCRRLSGLMHGDRPRFGDFLKRFDRDGDGRLSPEEEAEARAHRDKRSEEMRDRRRQEMLDRFDKDGDGALSDEEREEARRWREHDRPGDRPPGPGGPPRR
jgi:Ca2+-binding EF-hand superfamily protein